jgi:hypothetical protein
MLYHGFAGLSNNHQSHNVWRASVAYVTGSHSMKAGYQAAYEVTDIFGNFAAHGLQYQFSQQRTTGRAQPDYAAHHPLAAGQPHALRRVLRAGSVDAGPRDAAGRTPLRARVELLPRREERATRRQRVRWTGVYAAEAKGVTGYNDIAPRLGLAYDVFGNGRTAIKVNLSKYFQSAANDGVYIGTNKASTFAQTATRAWTDGNHNFVPDCDLKSPLLQDNLANGGDLCAASNPASFFAFAQDHSLGTATIVSPSLLSGWGVRPYDWQFSTSVQQELLPRVSAEFGYSRRSWGNFTSPTTARLRRLSTTRTR